jgi:hypothetical protein
MHDGVPFYFYGPREQRPFQQILKTCLLIRRVCTITVYLQKKGWLCEY